MGKIELQQQIAQSIGEAAKEAKQRLEEVFRKDITIGPSADDEDGTLSDASDHGCSGGS